MQWNKLKTSKSLSAFPLPLEEETHKTNETMSLQSVVKITDWHSHQKQLKEIREIVFIQEQSVPAELEWDGLDEKAYHVIAEVENDSGEKLAIGTARIIINNMQAHIGRMAVLSKWRGQGIGSQILHCCMDECNNISKKNRLEKIVLNAQVYAIEFYQKAGFEISSDEFLDAGIPHKQMTFFL